MVPSAGTAQRPALDLQGNLLVESALQPVPVLCEHREPVGAGCSPTRHRVLLPVNRVNEVVDLFGGGKPGVGS